MADVDLSDVPERCRCFVGDASGLAARDTAPRQASAPGKRSAEHLRVTGSAAATARGSAAAVTITLENTCPTPLVVHIADPWRDAHPILLAAKDAKDQRIDRPAGACDGSGARVEGALTSITSYRAVVLPPGAAARHSTMWFTREAAYLRDLTGNDRALAILRAISPCDIGSGKPLAPGRYLLNYDIGLMGSGDSTVGVGVDVR